MKPNLFTSAIFVLAIEALSTNCFAADPVRLNQAPSELGSVQSDFRVSGNGDWVVYRAASSAESTSYRLERLPFVGGEPIVVAGPVQSGVEVSSWQLTNDGGRAIYWANPPGGRMSEVFGAALEGGSSSKINSPLVDIGSTGGIVVGDHVVYIASERTNIFFEPYFDLFATPVTGGEVIQLSGPLVAGGDVHRVVGRANVNRIVYLADQDADGVMELYGVSVDDGSPLKLNPSLVTNGNVFADGLELSPDGNRVLYAADQEVDTVVEVFSVSTWGGPAVKLNGPLVAGGRVTAGSQRYSPDGTRALYHADETTDEVFEIYSVSSTGGTPVRLNGALVTNGDVRSQGLQFSPDGARVLYTADQQTDEMFELFSVPSQGGAAVRLNGELVSGGDVIDDATFSPDSNLVLYRADQLQDDMIELFSVPSIGGLAVRLNDTLAAGGNVVKATFTPDGNEVIYLADQEVDEVFELFAVPSGGGEVRKISGPMTLGGDVTDWQFTPDGRSLVYRADQEIDERFELFAVALNERLPGDFNRDGVVDAADYTVWRNGLGSTYTVEEYGVWKTNFGRRAGAGAVGTIQSAVPEPAALALAAGAILVSISGRQRRKWFVD